MCHTLQTEHNPIHTCPDMMPNTMPQWHTYIMHNCEPCCIAASHSHSLGLCLESSSLKNMFSIQICACFLSMIRTGQMAQMRMLCNCRNVHLANNARRPRERPELCCGCKQCAVLCCCYCGCCQLTTLPAYRPHPYTLTLC